MFLFKKDVCHQCAKHYRVDTRTKRQIHREVEAQSQGPHEGRPATEPKRKGTSL